MGHPVGRRCVSCAGVRRPLPGCCVLVESVEDVAVPATEVAQEGMSGCAPSFGQEWADDESGCGEQHDDEQRQVCDGRGEQPGHSRRERERGHDQSCPWTLARVRRSARSGRRRLWPRRRVGRRRSRGRTGGSGRSRTGRSQWGRSACRTSSPGRRTISAGKNPVSPDGYGGQAALPARQLGEQVESCVGKFLQERPVQVADILHPGA